MLALPLFLVVNLKKALTGLMRQQLVIKFDLIVYYIAKNFRSVIKFSPLDLGFELTLLGSYKMKIYCPPLLLLLLLEELELGWASGVIDGVE
jgi:hypothetical protein